MFTFLQSRVDFTTTISINDFWTQIHYSTLTEGEDYCPVLLRVGESLGGSGKFIYGKEMNWR